MNCRSVFAFLAGGWMALSATVAQEPATATYAGQVTLVRYDMPIGFSEGTAPTRQPAQRREGADAVDWPEFTLNGQPLWREGSEAGVPLRVRRGAEAASPFRAVGDESIEPGGHWFRAIEGRQKRRLLYTADRTARGGAAEETGPGRYELWAFPIVIEGEGGPMVKNVELKWSGRTIFRKAGPWRSLTLLLAASERGQPYELFVDGRGPVKFEAGLAPVKLGDPHEEPVAVNLALPGDGAKIAIRNAARPEIFPNQKEWDADVAALGRPLPAMAVAPRGNGLRRWLGAEVPRSPFTVYAMALPSGMSGGFFRQGGNVEEYAASVASAGFDAVFDPASALPAPEEAESFERRASAFARHGLRLGLQYDNRGRRPSLRNPALALFAHTLPDWHAPLYRSLSLTAQRFSRLPNFAGIDFGAGNAGYAPLPPASGQPWGEAMVELMGSAAPRIPRAPSLGPAEFPFEEPLKTQAEFFRHVERCDNAFHQYGYFAEAVREVDPRLVFTTATFGGGPGADARGGWPSASLPARIIYEGMATQQAYDWNETHAAKPLHNVALVDRLRSYHPAKATWALLDNYRFLHGREAWQRACALALTRGIAGLGTNFLPAATGEGARPDVLGWQAEMHAWIHRYGGVYARTQPVATIGVFFSHHAALQRPELRGAEPSQEALRRGSHEGKVTEALFLCHAAGWPARVITFQEMMRGALPDSMQAILLVGLTEHDTTWTWAPGLAPALQRFIERGGRILSDDESVCPIPATKTGLQVAAYLGQQDVDATPLLLARNRENIAALRAAMQGVPPPVAVPESPTLWAIPTACGDTQYVTAINQAFAEGEEAGGMLRPADPNATRPEIYKTKANASLYVKPQTGALKWSTDRPIYDVRLGRKLSAAEAANADLTVDSFRWYALPPAEVAKPEMTIAAGVSGFYEAKPTMMNGVRIDGVPVQITVSGPGDAATIYGATGQTLRLPLHRSQDPGDFVIGVTELLTGLTGSARLRIDPLPLEKRMVSAPVRLRDRAALARFATRQQAPLIVALTPEQQKDATFVTQARALAAFYRGRGREVAEQLGAAAAGGVVESLQPLRSPHRFPQWKTAAADLVLFGTPASNVLLLDQARGQLFPAGFAPPAAGEAEVIYTRSPFVGERDVVNVIATDAAGLKAAVQMLTATPPSELR